MRRWKSPFLLPPGAISTTPDYTQTNALVFQREDEQTKRKTDHSYRCRYMQNLFSSFFLIVRHDLSLVFARSRAKL
jgi:hypothetical protein